MTESFLYSNIGGCDKNDDSVGMVENPAGGYYALADGLGGQRFGDRASRIVVSELLKYEIVTSDDMNASFEKAEHALEAAQATGIPGARTTAVLLVVRGQEAMWGHSGDSRLYHFSQGSIATYTEDHSVSYRKHKGGEMDHNGIAGDEDRSSLLRSLGGKQWTPQIGFAGGLRDGDAFLLCSDGFWEYLRDEEMLIDLCKADSPRHWAELMLLRHIRRAKPNHDNYSLVAVFVKGGTA